MHRKSNSRANGWKTLYTSHNAEPRMHGDIIARNYLRTGVDKTPEWLKHAKSSSAPRFYLEINWKSRFTPSCKVFLGKSIGHHLRIHYTTRKPFLEYYQFLVSQNTVQNMKNILLFLDVFVLVLLVLIHLYRPCENLWCHDVTHVDKVGAR